MHILPAKKNKKSLPIGVPQPNYGKNSVILGFYEGLLNSYLELYDKMSEKDRKEVLAWLKEIDPLG